MVHKVDAAVDLHEARSVQALGVVAQRRQPGRAFDSFPFQTVTLAYLSYHVFEVQLWQFVVVSKVLTFFRGKTAGIVELCLEADLLQFSGEPEEAVVFGNCRNEFGREQLFEGQPVEEAV